MKVKNADAVNAALAKKLKVNLKHVRSGFTVEWNEQAALVTWDGAAPLPLNEWREILALVLADD